MARPVDRIPVIIEALRAAWTMNPNLRLGQLIENAGYFAEDGTWLSEAAPPPVFVREDDVTLAGLRGIAKRDPRE